MPVPDTRLSLLGRLKDANDFEAWVEFVEIYEPLICRLATKRGLQYADATDICQSVFSKVARAVETYDPKIGPFRTWLFSIANNLTTDHLRKWRTRNRHIVDVDQPELLPSRTSDDQSDFELEYEQELFRWASAKIQRSYKPENWKAFWMTTVEGLPANEVANQLGMSVELVYVARSRIAARLSREVKLRLEDFGCSAQKSNNSR